MDFLLFKVDITVRLVLNEVSDTLKEWDYIKGAYSF